MVQPPLVLLVAWSGEEHLPNVSTAPLCMWGGPHPRDWRRLQRMHQFGKWQDDLCQCDGWPVTRVALYFFAEVLASGRLLFVAPGEGQRWGGSRVELVVLWWRFFFFFKWRYCEHALNDCTEVLNRREKKGHCVS